MQSQHIGAVGDFDLDFEVALAALNDGVVERHKDIARFIDGARHVVRKQNVILGADESGDHGLARHAYRLAALSDRDLQNLGVAVVDVDYRQQIDRRFLT